MLDRRQRGEQLLHDGEPVEVLASVAVAVDGQSSTFGSICAKRSITLRAPKSGEQLDQIAPIDAHASCAAIASGMFGRYADHPIAGADAEAPQSGREPRHLLAAARPASSRRAAAAPTHAGSRPRRRRPRPQHVLGEVEARAREPDGARHLARREHALVRGRGTTSNRSQIDAQNPSRSVVDHSHRLA